MTGPHTDGPASAGGVSMWVTAATLTAAFGLFALGVEEFWIAFVVGFAGVLPVSVDIVKRRKAEVNRSNVERRDSTDSALYALRSRYARGELTDEEFERQVEQLVGTESGQTTPRERSSDPTRR